MTQLTETNNTERFEKFHSLEAGQYWRALSPNESENIEEGEVLLIQSVRYVEKQPHTIILRVHPLKYTDGNKEHRFLTEDFVSNFEYEPDFERIRKQELAAIQQTVNDLQIELVQTQSDPLLMGKIVEEQLSKQNEQSEDSNTNKLPLLQSQGSPLNSATSLSNVINSGVTESSIQQMRDAANHQHQITTIQAEWITSKTSEISKAIQSTTPFYHEQAAAALATTEQVRTHVTKLLDGIESLDLYVGKDVQILDIQKGQSANSSIPLHILQRKLYIDEECSVCLDIDEWFDHTQNGLFFDALKSNKKLVEQIFPSERSVVSVATTRRNIKYSECPITNGYMNAPNKHVFLLVRDGENIYRVTSPIDSHRSSNRLFPSKDDHDQIFRGISGEKIAFKDVQYTDALSNHQDYALHYKRFLILICGLDHNHRLFGDFYPGKDNLDFISLSFQETYMRFIHDDDGEGMLPKGQNKNLIEWINQNNGYLRSGSRVFCLWERLLDENTAPGACRNGFSSDSKSVEYQPENEFDVLVANESKNEFFVSPEVTGYTTDYRQRTFTCKVNLSKAQHFHSELSYICLDAIDPDELERYIQCRDTRENFLRYIKVFKLALIHIREERKTEDSTRQGLISHLLESGITTDRLNAKKLVDKAIIAWRCYYRGPDLPASRSENAKDWDHLLDLIYFTANDQTKHITQLRTILDSHDYTPLRFVLTGKGDLVCYASPSSKERDDRLTKHSWVHRIVFKRLKSGIKMNSKKWVNLKPLIASEITIYQWSDAENWYRSDICFGTYDYKKSILDHFEQQSLKLTNLGRFLGMSSYKDLLHTFLEKYLDIIQTRKFVQHPVFFVPIGLERNSFTSELSVIGLRVKQLPAYIYAISPTDKDKEDFLDIYLSMYQNKDKMKQILLNQAKVAPRFELVEFWLSSFKPNELTIQPNRGSDLHGEDYIDPSIDRWFDRYIERSHISEESFAKNFWFGSVCTDKQGKFAIDDILGIEKCDLAQVTKLYEWTFEQEYQGFKGCYHIFPRSEDNGHSMTSPQIPGGKSGRSTLYLTFDEALEAVKESDHEEVVESFNTDLPQPPDDSVYFYFK